jgi:hypothetical protein
VEPNIENSKQKLEDMDFRLFGFFVADKSYSAVWIKT